MGVCWIPNLNLSVILRIVAPTSTHGIPRGIYLCIKCRLLPWQNTVVNQEGYRVDLYHQNQFENVSFTAEFQGGME